MARGIIGKKLGMSQIFDLYGNLIPVTMIEAGPNSVIQVKTADGKDGYNAVKLGYGDKPLKRCIRPELGVFKHAKVEPKRHISEFRIASEDVASYAQGAQVDASEFAPGDKVDVTGTSKGRGYAGVVKRHGFKGAKEATHGTHEYKRHAGSIGCSAYPGHVIKGKRMPGQMGNKRVTVLGLEVVGVFPEDNLILIKGAVPGPPQGIVQIRVSG